MSTKVRGGVYKFYLNTNRAAKDVNMENNDFLFLHAASQKELDSFIYSVKNTELSYLCLLCSKDLVLNLWKTREQLWYVLFSWLESLRVVVEQSVRI